MNDRVFAELVRETDADVLAAAQANDRPEIGAGKYLERVRRTFE